MELRDTAVDLNRIHQCHCYRKAALPVSHALWTDQFQHLRNECLVAAVFTVHTTANDRSQEIIVIAQPSTVQLRDMAKIPKPKRCYTLNTTSDEYHGNKNI